MATLLNALKTLFNKSTSALTSSSRIPVLDSNNNVIGSDTMSNFAKVAAGQSTSIPENSDLDDYKNAGLYTINSIAIANTVNNVPAPYGTVVIVYRVSASFIFQVCLSNVTDIRIFIRRYNGSWGSWIELAKVS